MERFVLLLALLLCAPAFAADCAATNATGGDTRVFQPCTKNDIPTISGTEDVTAVDVWGPYHIACGPGGASPSWSGTLPTGLSVNTSTGRITGTPTADGSVASSLTCTNSVGSETISFTWNIAAAPGGGEPYDLTAGGSRTVPFSYEWPAEPVTTSTASVSSASAFNAAAAIDGTEITVTQSFSGNINVTADDIDVVMANNITISGRLTINSFSASGRLNRIRFTGGNFAAGSILIHPVNDLMLKDVYFDTDSNLASEGLNDFRGNSANSGIAGWDRIALVNTTINHVNGSSTGDYAFYAASRNNSTNLIFANVKLRAQGQVHRVIQLSKYIIVDSTFNDDGGASSAFRIHGDGGTATNEVYMADSMVRGTMKIDGTAGSQGPQIANGVFERVDRYANDGFWWYSEALASGNQATVNDSPIYYVGGDGVSEVGLGSGITGSNNIRQPWDGSTVPDYSGVGAIR
ncbi:MAG: Ig domain-containing protein [Pseudomonadaceae bacterium]|nr:Ig domain-containing protein [Pseudomonadaceae bacterium]